ncbi:MAG: TlpA disulfide reductase family protein [Planctomycetota bacterium]
MLRNLNVMVLWSLALVSLTLGTCASTVVASPQQTAAKPSQLTQGENKKTQLEAAVQDKVSPEDAAAVKKAFAMLSTQLKKERFNSVSLMSTERAFEEFFISEFIEAIAMSGAIGPFPGRELPIITENKLDEIDIEKIIMSANPASAQDDLRKQILAPFKGRQAMVDALAQLSKQSKQSAGQGIAMIQSMNFFEGEVQGVEKSKDGVLLVLKPNMPDMSAMMQGMPLPGGEIELDGPPQGGIIVGGPGEIPEGAKVFEIIVGPDGAAAADGGDLPPGIEIAGLPPGIEGGVPAMPGVMMEMPNLYLRFRKEGARWKWDGVDEQRMMEEVGDLGRMGMQRAIIEDPRFNGTAFSGEKISLEDYRGKVVLVDFWGTWCKPCVAELPRLKRIYEVLKPHGFEIVGIAEDDKASLKRFFKDQPLPWKNIVDGHAGTLAQKFNINAFPSSLLIDREGNHVANDLEGIQLAKQLTRYLKLDEKTAAKLEAAIYGEL